MQQGDEAETTGLLVAVAEVHDDQAAADHANEMAAEDTRREAEPAEDSKVEGTAEDRTPISCCCVPSGR